MLTTPLLAGLPCAPTPRRAAGAALPLIGAARRVLEAELVVQILEVGFDPLDLRRQCAGLGAQLSDLLPYLLHADAVLGRPLRGGDCLVALARMGAQDALVREMGGGAPRGRVCRPGGLLYLRDRDQVAQLDARLDHVRRVLVLRHRMPAQLEASLTPCLSLCA